MKARTHTVLRHISNATLRFRFRCLLKFMRVHAIATARRLGRQRLFDVHNIAADWNDIGLGKRAIARLKSSPVSIAIADPDDDRTEAAQSGDAP